MADPKSGNNGPKGIRIFRKDLMKSVDRDKLEVLDKSVEFMALILGLMLVILQLVVVPYSPVLGTLLNALNILAALFVWASYRIAVIKQAIDLRLWVLVNATKLFCAFVVMTVFFMFAPLVPNEYIGLYSLSMFVLPLTIIFAGAYASGYAEKRWFQLVGYTPTHPEGKEPPSRDALYIVDKVDFDWSVYVFSFLLIMLLSNDVLGSWRLTVALILMSLIMMAILFTLLELRMAQRAVLTSLPILKKAGS